MSTLRKIANLLSWQKKRLRKYRSCMIVGLDAHGRICFRDHGCEEIFVCTAMQIYSNKVLMMMFDYADQQTILQMVLDQAT